MLTNVRGRQKVILDGIADGFLAVCVGRWLLDFCISDVEAHSGRQ